MQLRRVYLCDCCLGGGRPAAACLSQSGVSEQQAHVEPSLTPLPTNGRNRHHDSPKINPEPCGLLSDSSDVVTAERGNARRSTNRVKHLRFHHLRALKVGSEGHPGVHHGCIQDSTGSTRVCVYKSERVHINLHSLRVSLISFSRSS